MGRRKNPVRKIQKGTVYLVDRRFDFFQVFRKIVSRQHSKNLVGENAKWFPIRPAPITTTLMVSSHETFFGREYVKVLVANSDQEVTLGYMELAEFLRVICGKPTWVIVE
jgi:hypothetical protein